MTIIYIACLGCVIQHTNIYNIVNYTNIWVWCYAPKLNSTAEVENKDARR